VFVLKKNPLVDCCRIRDFILMLLSFSGLRGFFDSLFFENVESALQD
jgi:hypothetical protein